ncbi:MAG: hypothetical protein ACTSQ8_18890 [Candidatus Helarchaeota archaeon]
METYITMLWKFCSYAQLGVFIEELVSDKNNITPIERVVMWRIANRYIDVVRDDGSYNIFISKTKRMNEYERADTERDIRHFWIEKSIKETIGVNVAIDVARRPVSRKRIRQVDELIKSEINKSEKEKINVKNKVSMMFT